MSRAPGVSCTAPRATASLLQPGLRSTYQTTDFIFGPMRFMGGQVCNLRAAAGFLAILCENHRSPRHLRICPLKFSHNPRAARWHGTCRTVPTYAARCPPYVYVHDMISQMPLLQNRKRAGG